MLCDIIASLMTLGITFSWAESDFNQDGDIGWVIMPIATTAFIVWRIWT